MTIPHARWVGTAAAALSAMLYALIGVEILTIGDARSGENDLLAFGLTAGIAFVLVALVVAFAKSRWLLSLAGLFDVVVLVGYFAFAEMREPAFELWGLFVKLCQMIVLAAIAYVLVRWPKGRSVGRGGNQTSVALSTEGNGGIR
jgi:hypothetical protein